MATRSKAATEPAIVSGSAGVTSNNSALTYLAPQSAAGTPISRVVIFSFIVFLCESLITVVNRKFQSRERTQRELRYWAWGKTALSACNGCAWSLGPILLHVSGEPISVLLPAWGIVNYTGAAVLAGSFYAPSMHLLLGRCVVVGGGKSAALMAAALEEAWPDVALEGTVVTRYGHAVPTGRIEVIEASHPVPDDNSERGAKRLLEDSRSAELLRSARSAPRSPARCAT